MLEQEQVIERLAGTLERLGAPFGLPEDWIILCDDDDLRFMPRRAAKKLLARAKKETARRWLYERFDPSEIELELGEEYEGDDDSVGFEQSVKQRAISAIDDVVLQVESRREQYKNLTDEITQPVAHEATVAARRAFGYPEGRPSRSDCFDEDVRRQCRRVVNETYDVTEKSSGSVV